MKKTRVLSSALALLMCLGLLPMGAMAAGEKYVIKEVAPLGMYDFFEGVADGLLKATKYVYLDEGHTRMRGETTWLNKNGMEQEYSGDIDYSGAVNTSNLSLRHEDAKHLYYVDSEGKRVITVSVEDDFLRFVEGTDFSEGYALITFDTVYGGDGGDACLYFIIDETPANYTITYGTSGSGGIVKETWYVYKTSQGEGVADELIYKSEGVRNFVYGNTQHNFSNGLVVVSNDYEEYEDEEGNWHTHNMYGYMDTTGTMVIPAQYSDAYDFADGVALVKAGSTYYLINQTGETVGTIGDYDSVRPLGEGFYQMNKDGTVGAISITAKAGSTPITYTAAPTNDALTVDGESKVPSAYKINNANYFLLRDVAMMLGGTQAQFSVDYDEARQAVAIVTGQPYTPLGTELTGAAQGTAEAIATNNDIYINGEKADLEVFKIGGANYFKIRDLGRALGFNVGWSQEKGMFIQSDKPYTDAD